jgi:hypothetical protein
MRGVYCVPEQMAKGSDSRPVVYCYVDPAFTWDIGPALADLERRGFRVVTGDHADELLFLLQMGRPAAVIYTVSGPEARADANFHTVTSRALDILVPVFVVGPDDPRDGVLLCYPAGGTVEESHAPFHALGDLIERFDSVPPSTPSRPPMAVAGQTFGKGRTMMSWRRDGPIVTPPNDLRSPYEMIDARPAPSAAPPPAVPGERKTFPRKKKGDSADGGSPESAPDAAISADVAPGREAELARAVEPVRVARIVPEPERRSKESAPRRTAWKIPAALAGGVAIGVAALVVYLVTAPGPAADSTKPAPHPADPRAAETPAAETPAAETPAQDEVATPRRPAPDEPRAQEVLLLDASGAVRFPGHFREQSAIFWFTGELEERRFLDLLRSLGPKAKIRVIGHATAQELAAGLHNLALSRAWAVEKYLVRMGIADEQIEPETGDEAKTEDLDYRGWPRNRWVDVRFD